MTVKRFRSLSDFSRAESAGTAGGPLYQARYAGVQRPIHHSQHGYTVGKSLEAFYAIVSYIDETLEETMKRHREGS